MPSAAPTARPIGPRPSMAVPARPSEPVKPVARPFMSLTTSLTAVSDFGTGFAAASIRLSAASPSLPRFCNAWRTTSASLTAKRTATCGSLAIARLPLGLFALARRIHVSALGNDQQLAGNRPIAVLRQRRQRLSQIETDQNRAHPGIEPDPVAIDHIGNR